jgi:hypothetical protein
LVTTIKITRLRWAGHIVRMQDNLPCKKITLDKPEGRMRAGRPNLRWMDGWSDEGFREVGSQELEDQGQGQRWLETSSWVGQDPALVVAPGSEWVSASVVDVIFKVNKLVSKVISCFRLFFEEKCSFLDSTHLPNFSLSYSRVDECYYSHPKDTCINRKINLCYIWTVF